MDKDKLKEIFHSFFNKINNICLLSASNKRILQEGNLDKLSGEELRQKTSELVEAFNRIEDNARSLDEALKNYYVSSKEENPTPQDSSK